MHQVPFKKLHSTAFPPSLHKEQTLVFVIFHHTTDSAAAGATNFIATYAASRATCSAPENGVELLPHNLFCKSNIPCDTRITLLDTACCF